MAWEEFQRGTVRGISGDFPFDEMSSAVKRIRRSYLERFGRSPYFAELLYALQVTVAADPAAYVEDSSIPRLEQLAEAAGAEPASEHIDPGHYVAVIDEETADFLVFPRDTPTAPQTRDSMALRGDVSDTGENGLLCRYATLTPSLTDHMAKSVIRQCVLQDLLGRNIADGNLTIRFERRA